MNSISHKYPVSIIIPIYNSINYLEKCIDSLMQQSLNNIEFIFVDDKSTDGSLNKLKELLSNYTDKHYKIIEHATNLGSAQSRNSGLEKAEGEYIGWMDSDDYIDVNMYKALYDRAKKENYDLVWCDFLLVFNKDIQQKNQDYSTNNLEFMNGLINNEIQGMLWNKIMRSDIIRENKITFINGANMGEDRAFLFKFLYYSTKISHLKGYYYYYDQTNSAALTRDLKSIRIYEEIANNKSILEFIDKHGIKGISDEAILNFKFRSKKKLLHSKDLKDFENWKNIFSECNHSILSQKINFHHKILGIASNLNMWSIIKIWIFLKRRINNQVS